MTSEIQEIEKATAFATPEEEIVLVSSRTLKAMFSGAQLCIRVVDPDTHGVRCLYAEGTLLPGACDRILVKRHAAEKTGLRIPTGTGKVGLTDSYHPVFDGGGEGTCTPLVAGGHLFGAINIERPPGQALTAQDKLLLIMMANQMALSLRTVRGLQQSSARSTFIEKALEAANTLVVVIDLARRVRFINRAVADLIARSATEVIGTDILEWFPESERVGLARIVVSTVRGRSVDKATVTLHHPDGRKTPIVVSTAPILDEDGEVSGIIATGKVAEAPAA